MDNEKAQIYGYVNIAYFKLFKEVIRNQDSVRNSMASILLNVMPSPGADILADALPYRMAGLHFCSDDSRLEAVMAAVQMAIGRDNRLRLRTHYGKL